MALAFSRGIRRGAAAMYRQDLASREGRDAFGGDDGVWLAVAGILARAAMRPAGARELVGEAVSVIETHLDTAAIVRGNRLDPPERRGAIEADLVRIIAEQAEDAGALNLAGLMLDGLAQAADWLSPLDQGRLVAHRARIAWKLGELDAAETSYRNVLALGRQSRDVELTVRAEIGFGVLAHMRGNYPELGRWASRAAARAASAGFTQLHALAEQGCMVAAGVAGHFDEALVHGWVVYRAWIGDPTAEAEALTNIAQLLAEIGHTEAALAGFAAVLSRRVPIRLVPPAIGGFTTASALLGDADAVRWAARELRRSPPGIRHTYHYAMALADCFAALIRVGETALAQPVRAEALRIGEAQGFHEIAFRLEAAARAAEAARPERRALAPAAAAVAREVHELRPRHLPEHLELIGAPS